MATFLRGKRAVKQETRRIVPSKLKLSRTKKKGSKRATVTTDCGCTVGHDGFKFCYDGNEIVLDDYPTTGGPWTPAVKPNGQVVWVNQGVVDAPTPR